MQAVNLFSACLTQFRTSFAGITGLDYCALEKAALWLEIKITKDIFYKIQLLERKVLESIKANNE